MLLTVNSRNSNGQQAMDPQLQPVLVVLVSLVLLAILRTPQLTDPKRQNAPIDRTAQNELTAEESILNQVWMIKVSYFLISCALSADVVLLLFISTMPVGQSAHRYCS